MTAQDMQDQLGFILWGSRSPRRIGEVVHTDIPERFQQDPVIPRAQPLTIMGELTLAEVRECGARLGVAMSEMWPHYYRAVAE